MEEFLEWCERLATWLSLDFDMFLERIIVKGIFLEVPFMTLGETLQKSRIKGETSIACYYVQAYQ